MKEIAFVQVEGGYIVKSMDQANGQKLTVTPNFGQAVKIARAFFDEGRTVEGKTVVEAE